MLLSLSHLPSWENLLPLAYLVTQRSTAGKWNHKEGTQHIPIFALLHFRCLSVSKAVYYVEKALFSLLFQSAEVL